MWLRLIFKGHKRTAKFKAPRRGGRNMCGLEGLTPSLGGIMQTLWQDLRYGARMLWKNPGFTVIAVITLALGVGANTAIFQLLNAVRLRSLPVYKPEELAEAHIAEPRSYPGNYNGRRPELTNPLWEQIRERQQAFSGVFAWGTATFDLSPRGEQRFTEDGLWVSGDFFNVLGVRPALGRVFTQADDQRGCGSPGVVISHAFWRRAFGADASVLGKKITLNGHPFEMTANREGVSLRRVLVVSQVALSLVLMVGALLFTRSLYNLITLDAGFAQDGVLQTDMNLAPLNLPSERRYAVKRELLDRLRAMPGVEAGAFANVVPLGGNNWGDMIFVNSARGVEKGFANFNRISPDYFKTLGIQLLAGRDFGDGDTPAAPKVAIVNESFARRYLDGASPLGRTFRIEAGPGETEYTYEIVAMAHDTKYDDLRAEFKPIIYLPASQQERQGSYEQILLRSNLPIASLMTAVRQALGAANPGIAFHFHVFKTQIRESLMRERLMATLSGFFGALAALLGAIGLYGVLQVSGSRCQVSGSSFQIRIGAADSILTPDT